MTADTDNKTVLYIAGLGDLMPYDSKRKKRSSPLTWGKLPDFTPLPVKGTSVAERIRHDQFNTCRQELKTCPFGWTCLGLFDEILREFGFNQRAGLRGWIVNSKYQAASAAEVAVRIKCGDVRLVQRGMRHLVKNGLLVRVDLPDLAAAV